MFKENKNSGILNKNKIKKFFLSFSPSLISDLRGSQFINYKVMFFVKEMIELGCKLAVHRNGKILRAKDIRFFIYQDYRFMPLILGVNKKKTKKNFKKKTQ